MKALVPHLPKPAMKAAGPHMRPLPGTLKISQRLTACATAPSAYTSHRAWGAGRRVRRHIAQRRLPPAARAAQPQEEGEGGREGTGNAGRRIYKVVDYTLMSA
eukprot:scaffold297327_cov35-Tisochrysis_lutea.AAC.2